MLNLKEKNSSIIMKNCLSLTFLSFSIIIAVILVYSIDKGYDFSDESCFLLNLNYPEKYPGGIYNYHLIFLHFFGFLPKSIILFRLYGILILLSGTVILFFGLRKFINSNNGSFQFRSLDLFNLAFVSSFLFFCVNIYTINNNILSQFFLLIVSSILLYFASLEILNFSLKNIFLIIVISIVSILFFFNKFSTACILFFITNSLFIGLFFKKNKMNLLKLLLLFVFSSLLTLQYYFTFIQSYESWIYLFNKELFILSDHKPSHLINQYFTQIISFILFFLKFYSWIFCYPIIYYLISKKIIKVSKKLIFFLQLTFILIYLLSLYYFKYYECTLRMGPFNHAFIYLINVFLFFSLFLIDQKKNIKSKDILLIVFLLILPFVGSIGTANNLFLNALFHGFSWVILVVFFVSKISMFKKLNLFLLLILISITTSQTISGIIQFPYYSFSFNYGNKTNLFDENQKVNSIPHLKDLYINPKNKVFLEKLNAMFIKHKLHKRPIICYYYPGIPFLMNGYSPGPNFYFSTERDAKGYSYLKGNPPPVIIEHKPISVDLIKVLESKNINFPSDYLLVDSIYFYNPNCYLKIFKPKLKLSKS
jgi:hypothetical protein